MFRFCTRQACETLLSPTSVGVRFRWTSHSDKSSWKPGSSWRKVARSEYTRTSFQTFRSKLPDRKQIIELLFKGPKSLRVPETVKQIRPYRRNTHPVTRHSFVFSFFRVIYNYMDTSGKYIMLYYRPTAFAAFFTSASYVGCTIWQYEDIRMGRSSSGSRLNPLNWNIQPPSRSSSSPDVTTVNLLNFNVSGWLKEQIILLRKHIRHYWYSQATEADKLFWPLFAINGLVFLLWRFDPFASVMVPLFTASPTNRFICTPFLFSVFSHYSFTHFALNMFVLHSFLPAAVSLLGKHYALYLFLTGGVLSSYGSHMFKMLKGNTIPSLGASGAIMALLGFVCTQTPDAKLGVVFIPGLSFSADTGLKCLMTMDAAGLVFGWRLMDHAAHLSGAIFGVLFSHLSPHLEPVRQMILKTWHEIRTFGRG